jgi:hypothetical protein
MLDDEAFWRERIANINAKFRKSLVTRSYITAGVNAPPHRPSAFFLLAVRLRLMRQITMRPRLPVALRAQSASLCELARNTSRKPRVVSNCTPRLRASLLQILAGLRPASAPILPLEGTCKLHRASLYPIIHFN